VAEVKNYVSIEKQQSWGSQIKDKDDKKNVKTLTQNTTKCANNRSVLPDTQNAYLK